MTSAILDASALLALLLSEPGGQGINSILADSAMSTVNWAEVVGYLARKGVSEHAIHSSLDNLPIERIPFDEPSAYAAGLMLPLPRSAGLSLGDRACLALAARMGIKVVTADKPWKALGGALGIDVELIR